MSSILSADEEVAGAGAEAGARRGAVLREAAPRVVRFTARRAVLRDPAFFRVAFLLLGLRDFAFIFAFVRRFFAMRAPSNLNARVF
jgi:hypothetical protein